ncbi:RNA polymerase sigma factor [Microbacterium oxydans]|uniref:RNA polymerase sigma factor n=1 Tax=Microbacterium oxydans TaxID=82380 RepID=UPI00226BAF18|nr:sigma-70 family RNA polymerase sigma factor [Microbacterium oxydans]WAA65033.1 sigma-70 family RNA polymerase sigma factor [Microbacterium oxydans]
MNASIRTQKLLTAALRESNGDILRYLQRRVGPVDAPDLFGETLLIAWRRVDDLPENPLETRMWLFGLARGTLQNHARGERRRAALADRIRAHMPRVSDTPAADEGDEVRDALSRLRPELAEIVQLVHWDGFRIGEAAEIVGVPAATARSRYARAKQELRAALGALA